MSAPVFVETAQAHGDIVFELYKALGACIEEAKVTVPEALASLLTLCMVIGRPNTPVVDDNLKPFLQDVSTYMMTYEFRVKTAKAARELGGVPEPPKETVN